MGYISTLEYKTSSIWSYTKTNFGGGECWLIAYIVDDQIEDIWYTDFVYYKTLLPPDPKMFRMKVAEKTVHYFYSDSNRDNLMKGSPITSEFWLDGYKKN